MKLTLRRATFVVVLAAGTALGLVWYARGEGYAPPPLETAPVKRGDLVSTISATGTLEPVEVVDVGAQVVGRIVAFGEDRLGKTIDYGSVVEAGTVLARIDDSTYAAEVAQSDAQLEQNKAAVARSLADLDQSRAKLVQAQHDWDRAKELETSKIISSSDYDGSEAAYEVAKANVEVSDAAVTEARKAEAQASAALDHARLSLSYCTIKSPVKGVIIDRRVNIGQTVVSSLNAPSLFLIAKDLGHMQVWVSVNEADIGSIHAGQPATFTVDAFPGRSFRGTVDKIRLNAAMTQNVVTYTVVVNTDNSDGALLPYLTANVEFETSRADDALLVPNAALRWHPKPGESPAATGASRERAADGTGRHGEREGTVWIRDGGRLDPVTVKPGLSDGVSTAVASDALREGMQVVVGEQLGASGSASPGANPFTPQFRRRRPEATGRQP